MAPSRKEISQKFAEDMNVQLVQICTAQKLEFGRFSSTSHFEKAKENGKNRKTGLLKFLQKRALVILVSFNSLC